MVSVLASSVVGRGFEPRSGQTKAYKIGICCFSTKHAVLRRKCTDWLAHGLLFQWASTMKIELSILIYKKASFNWKLMWNSWKNCWVGAKQQSLTHSLTHSLVILYLFIQVRIFSSTMLECVSWQLFCMFLFPCVSGIKTHTVGILQHLFI